MLLSQCYLVTTVVHIVSTHTDMGTSVCVCVCIYIYIYIHTHTHAYSSQCREAGRVKELRKLRQQWQPSAKDTFPRTILGTRVLGSPTMVKSSVSQTALAEPLVLVRGGVGRGGGGKSNRKKNPCSLSQTTSSFTRAHFLPYSTEGCASQLWICGKNV